MTTFVAGIAAVHSAYVSLLSGGTTSAVTVATGAYAYFGGIMFC